MSNTDATTSGPEPRCSPQPITPEEYQAGMPEKVELVDGYIFGKDQQEARLKLLRILLTNCRLEALAGCATRMSG